MQMYTEIMCKQRVIDDKVENMVQKLQFQCLQRDLHVKVKMEMTAKQKITNFLAVDAPDMAKAAS